MPSIWDLPSITATQISSAGTIAMPAVQILEGGVEQAVQVTPAELGAAIVPGNVPLGVTARTAAAGNDPRITGAAQVANNLADLESAAAARGNLGLGTAAVLPAGTPGGVAALNALGQMAAPVAGDISLGTVYTPAARSMATRVLDVVNVLDFAADRSGINDCTAAFNAAFAALPSEGGEIWVPAGSYVLASPLAWGGKTLSLRGDGKAATRLVLTHAGVGITITQASNYAQVMIRDLEMVANNSASACAGGIEVVYPSPIDGWHRDTVLIENVGFSGTDNAVSGTTPAATFTKGVLLRGARNARILNLAWSGPDGANGVNVAADAIDIGNCIDTRISRPTCYYGRSLVFQSDYCEGIWLDHALVVGTDYMVAQDPAAGIMAGQPGAWPSRGGPLSGLGLWCTAGEVNTNFGAFQLNLWAGGWVFGLDVTREGGATAAEKLISLTDCQNFVIAGCNLAGNISGGQDTGVYIAEAQRDASGNLVIGNHFAQMATSVDTSKSSGNTIVGINSGQAQNYIPYADAGGNFYHSMQLAGAQLVNAANPAAAVSGNFVVVNGGSGGIVLPPVDVGGTITVVNYSGGSITVQPPGSGKFWGGVATLSQANNTVMLYSSAGTLGFQQPNWFQTGIAPLNDAGQMTAPVAADITQATLAFSGISAVRTMGARSLDRVNVLDFGADRTGTSDCTAAFNAAFAALPAAGGSIWVPAGSYSLASPLAWSGKTVTLLGDGKTATRLVLTHTSVGITITQPSNYLQVMIRDLEMVAASSTGACAGGIEVVYSAPVGGWHRDTVRIENVAFSGTDNAVSGTAPAATFSKGVLLRGTRNARIIDLGWSGPSSGSGGVNIAADAIDLGNCIDTRISRASCYYGRSLVFQSDYCEGIWLEGNSVVGTDYAVTQDPGASIEAGQSGAWPNRPGALSGINLVLSGGEVTVDHGAVNLNLFAGGTISGLQVTRSGGPSAAQPLISLTDCQNMAIIGCSLIGNGAGADTGIIIAESQRDASGNVVAGNHFGQLATSVDTSKSSGNSVVGINSGQNFIPYVDAGGNFYQSMQLGGAQQVNASASPYPATSSRLVIIAGGTGGILLPPADVGQEIIVANETSAAVTIQPPGSGKFWGGAATVSQPANSVARYVSAGTLGYSNVNWLQA